MTVPETKQAADLTEIRIERRLPALAVSRGIGIGQLFFLYGQRRQFFRLNLEAGQIDGELQRFRSALATSVLQLREIAANGSAAGESVPGIFGVHLLILESSFAEKIETLIKNQRVNVEWAIRSVSEQYLARQETVPDPTFREKHVDIEDVANRLLTALGNMRPAALADQRSVIVARELTPSVIVEFAKSRPAALITEQGGWTPHSAILAREFNLPMVSGVRNIELFAHPGGTVIVDGMRGEVILNPVEETIAQFATLGASNRTTSNSGEKGVGEQLVTEASDFVIRANVDQPEAYLAVQDRGVCGIGLYRSESLILQPGAIPTEDEQVHAYSAISDAAGEYGVKIRTFDVGKEGFEPHEQWAERNPALGLRAIRLSLADDTHFRTQLRAILRAAFGRNIDITLPMISGIDEITQVKAIIDEERVHLSKAGTDIGAPRLGAMIETPSAVLTAHEIAKQVDFLCLGTNDLVQYLLAVDRDNDAVHDWYQTLHPAVIRAIGEVISAAEVAGVPLTVCGEMAGSPFYVPILLGLGARDLSMNINSIEPVRRLIAGISVDDAVTLVQNIRTLTTTEQIETYLREYYLKNWRALFPTGFLEARYR